MHSIIPGWNFNNSRWTFKESATCESILNSPILPTAGLASENQRMMSLIVGLSLLKTHFWGSNATDQALCDDF